MEAFVGPNVVNHSLIDIVCLTHLFKFSESRVISEDVLGLSDDPEAEFIPGTLGTTSCITLIARLTVLFD